MAGLSWQRLVIKVGSALVAPQGHQHHLEHLAPIADFIRANRAEGKEVILVSSGSVAAGRHQIKHQHKASIAEKQAMAAIGQSQMMANWASLFDFPCAQLLLTSDDLHNRTRYVNIKNTLRELLKNQALPIINENDSVAINELKVGDNDNLAAYTALVAQADTLIICSDVQGLYDANPQQNPNAKLLSEIEAITPEHFNMASGTTNSLGTGGMTTKLQAAHKCSQSGIQTLIVNGSDPTSFQALMEGNNPGTRFKPTIKREKARQRWLRHTLKSKGKIDIDQGAMQALTHKGASLLPVGIVKLQGQFQAGEPVEICSGPRTLGKGLSLYSSQDLSKILGQRSDQVSAILGYSYGEEAIHRDDLILY